jgi:hypothetical protein
MYFQLNPVCDDSGDRNEFIFSPELIKIVHYSSEPKPWSRLVEKKFAAYTDEEWLDEVLRSFTGYQTWVLKDPEFLQREINRNSSLALGPDGTLHEIDWSKVRGGWKTQSAARQTSVENEQLGTNQVTSRASAEDMALPEEPCVYSADGWPLGRALVPSQPLVDAARNALQFTQVAWFDAFQELSVKLDEHDLAAAVRNVTTGPVIREVWPTGGYSEETNDKLAVGIGTAQVRADQGLWIVESVLGSHALMRTRFCNVYRKSYVVRFVAFLAVILAYFIFVRLRRRLRTR